MNRLWPLLSVFAWGCGVPDEGIAVGNPGQLDVFVQDVPEGVVLDSARFSVASIELMPCGSGDVVVLDPVEFDVIGLSPVEHPAGEWCEAFVLPDGDDALTLVGTNASGQPFDFALSPEAFSLLGPYAVDGGRVAIVLVITDSLENSIEEAEIDIGPDTGVAFEPELVVPDGLYVIEENGEIRFEDGPLASPDSASGGCGCSNSGPQIGWLLFATLLWLPRRRRWADVG